MLKVSKLPESFNLPKYEVPWSHSSDETNPWVKFLKWLRECKAVPVEHLIPSYTTLLFEEQGFQYKALSRHEASIFYDEGKECFVITVRGMEKDNTSISGGDLVHLIDKTLETEHVLFITSISDGFLDAVPFGCNKSIKWYSKETNYDITFELSQYPLRSAQYAISKMETWSFKDNILKPKLKLLGEKKNKVYDELQLSWFDSRISSNKEQTKAIHDIINKTAHPTPYILFGPPGTGKTATIVEAISQIYCLSGTDKVLVCTPANSPADAITKMLRKNHRMANSNAILRLYSVSQETKLDEEIVKCANVYYETGSGDKRQVISREEIMNKRVIICTLTFSLRLLTLGLGSSYFSHIFIDEAAQASEPETWIPISLLVDETQTSTQIVLSGDPMQLGPIVKSRQIEHLLGVSMMERLMTFDCYKGNNKKHFITKLIKTYRCHSAIMKIPNELFYKGELEYSKGLDISQKLTWKYLSNDTFPIIFHAVNGEENRKEIVPSDSDSPYSPFNEAEVRVCLEYIEKLREEGEFEEKDIGVITPFKEQKILIQDELKRKKISKIEVGTVQTFQGLEKDVIIMSTVRSYEFNPLNTFLGFLSNKKRFNVSITRAKSLLIIVGNPEILRLDETWYKFIKYCDDNNAIKGEKLLLQKPDVIKKTPRAIKNEGKRKVAKPNTKEIDKLTLKNVNPSFENFHISTPVQVPTQTVQIPAYIPSRYTSLRLNLNFMQNQTIQIPIQTVPIPDYIPSRYPSLPLNLNFMSNQTRLYYYQQNPLLSNIFHRNCHYRFVLSSIVYFWGNDLFPFI